MDVGVEHERCAGAEIAEQFAEDCLDQRTAYFGPLGLTATSSARLNVLAQDAVEVELLFLDTSGATVADSGPLSLAPKQATSLTLAGSSLTYPPGALRAQVQARVQLLSPPGHALAFATLELLDPDTTVLVLYPVSPIRALATNALTLGPLALTGSTGAGITVASLASSSFPNNPIGAKLSFFSLDGTLLKQEYVMLEPGHTATLSMSGVAFSGEVIGTINFASTPVHSLTVSSLQLFDSAAGVTRVALYPNTPVFPTSPIHAGP